jgi:hypothetical protein
VARAEQHHPANHLAGREEAQVGGSGNGAGVDVAGVDVAGVGNDDRFRTGG